MRASGCWGWRRGQDSQARILTSGRLQRRVQAAKTGRTRNTALFPGHTHTRVTYTGLGFWRMNEASRFLQLLWVPAPSPQSPLLRRHLPEPTDARCSSRPPASSTVSPPWVCCPLGHSAVAWNATIAVYLGAPLHYLSKHPSGAKQAGSPSKCFDLSLCPERRLKTQKGEEKNQMS